MSGPGQVAGGRMLPAEPEKPHRKAARGREQRGCARGGSEGHPAEEKSVGRNREEETGLCFLVERAVPNSSACG